MRAHLSNAAYGVLDYAAYPIAMLVSAPALLKHLGVAQYGVWIVTTAALNTGAIIASGFGDANIQYIASARSQGNADLLLRAVRSMFGINLVLGVALAVISWMLMPLAVSRLVSNEGQGPRLPHLAKNERDMGHPLVRDGERNQRLTLRPISVPDTGRNQTPTLDQTSVPDAGMSQRLTLRLISVHETTQRVAHISHVFREMWETRTSTSTTDNSADLQAACLFGLRIASILMLVRAIESVCVSTQRAFQRYGEAIRISLLARIISVAAAVLLSLRGFGVAAIMAATACFMILGTAAQFIRLHQYLGATSLWPSFDRRATSALFGFGAFSWLLAVASVLFTQADRLLLGVSLGASTVTAYALCVQMAQPIYGIASSGLHFLFPYLSGRSVSQPTAMRQPILLAFAVNLLIVAAGTGLLLLFGQAALNAWVGPSVAQSAAGILAPIAWSFALLGLSVTAYYSSLALGQVRMVTALNLTGGLAMLLLMAWLLPVWGVHGIAIARLAYGAVALLMYVPLARVLGGTRAPSLSPAGTV
jgi:O-antigen/teichoic acid export membrane protein